MSIVLLVIALICAVNWLKWKIAAKAMIHYMVKNGYKYPDNADMKSSCEKVIRHMLRRDRK